MTALGTTDVLSDVGAVESRGAAGLLALEVMHEVRNPLEALSNLVYLTQADHEQPDRVCEYMTLAEEQLATLTRIVSRTLNFARSPAAPTASSLTELTDAALRIHQHCITAKGVNLVREVPEGMVATVHPSDILQVVSNLIVNALDAMPQNGTLRLRLRKGAHHIHCLVVDNGHGIPHKHLKRIFEPFFTTKEERGTGLGLALSRKIVERHGGKLSVRSSIRPGHSGTAFRISLPA